MEDVIYADLGELFTESSDVVILETPHGTSFSIQVWYRTHGIASRLTLSRPEAV
jgi:hypothetical protein